jgi:hypothetical protein
MGPTLVVVTPFVLYWWFASSQFYGLRLFSWEGVRTLVPFICAYGLWFSVLNIYMLREMTGQ